MNRHNPTTNYSDQNWDLLLFPDDNYLYITNYLNIPFRLFYSTEWVILMAKNDESESSKPVWFKKLKKRIQEIDDDEESE